MRKLILSTAAALAITAIPAFAGAQQSNDPNANASTSASGSAQAGDQNAGANGSANVDSTPAGASTNATTSTTWSPSSTTTGASATTGAGAGVDFQGAEAAPAPPASYPICKGKIQDECRNPREAGLNYGNRPLKYWPGHPASQ